MIVASVADPARGLPVDSHGTDCRDGREWCWLPNRRWGRPQGARDWRGWAAPGPGRCRTMSDDEPTVDDERVSSRAELLAEEKAAGSEDPEAQAEAILADSDERTA